VIVYSLPPFRRLSAGRSGVRCTLTAAHNDKCQARPLTDHFERLLKEACPNNAYPIKHKLKDCGMMKSFMTLESLTWGAGLEEDPGGSNTMPFPMENTVMVVYGGHPPSVRRCESNLSPMTSTRCGLGHRGSGV
jgi:hypothetical protein